MDKNISRVFRPIEAMKYSTKGKTCLFHFRRFRFENVVAKTRRVQKVLEWMESSSEVTQLRITRHGMAKLKSSCKRNTLSSLFFFLLLLSLFLRSKVKFSFLLERWGWYFWKLSAEISRTIFERIYRFEQKETARNFQIFRCFIERGWIEDDFNFEHGFSKGIYRLRTLKKCKFLIFLNFIIPVHFVHSLFFLFLLCTFCYPKIKLRIRDLVQR